MRIEQLVANIDEHTLLERNGARSSSGPSAGERFDAWAAANPGKAAALSFVPGVGSAMDARDAYNQARAGNYGQAALSAGTAALGLIPGVGSLVSGGARTASRAARAAKGADAAADAAKTAKGADAATDVASATRRVEPPLGNPPPSSGSTASGTPGRSTNQPPLGNTQSAPVTDITGRQEPRLTRDLEPAARRDSGGRQEPTLDRSAPKPDTKPGDTDVARPNFSQGNYNITSNLPILNRGATSQPSRILGPDGKPLPPSRPQASSTSSAPAQSGQLPSQAQAADRRYPASSSGQSQPSGTGSSGNLTVNVPSGAPTGSGGAVSNRTATGQQAPTSSASSAPAQSGQTQTQTGPAAGGRPYTPVTPGAPVSTPSQAPTGTGMSGRTAGALAGGALAAAATGAGLYALGRDSSSSSTPAAPGAGTAAKPAGTGATAPAAPSPAPTGSSTAAPKPQTDQQSFAQAFAAARKAAAATGDASTGQFTWQGKQYQTNVAGEPYVPPSQQRPVGTAPAATAPTTAPAASSGSVLPSMQPGDLTRFAQSGTTRPSTSTQPSTPSVDYSLTGGGTTTPKLNAMGSTGSGQTSSTTTGDQDNVTGVDAAVANQAAINKADNAAKPDFQEDLDRLKQLIRHR